MNKSLKRIRVLSLWCHLFPCLIVFIALLIATMFCSFKELDILLISVYLLGILIFISEYKAWRKEMDFIQDIEKTIVPAIKFNNDTSDKSE
jgi:hypothetical protein